MCAEHDLLITNTVFRLVCQTDIHDHVYGPNRSLTDREAILKRWAEHFNSVVNRPSSINEGAIDRLPQIECNVLLDEFPTVMETRNAVQQLTSGKAPDADATSAEVYKAGGLPVAEKLIELFHCMWRKDAILQNLRMHP